MCPKQWLNLEKPAAQGWETSRRGLRNQPPKLEKPAAKAWETSCLGLSNQLPRLGEKRVARASKSVATSFSGCGICSNQLDWPLQSNIWPSRKFNLSTWKGKLFQKTNDAPLSMESVSEGTWGYTGIQGCPVFFRKCDWKAFMCWWDEWCAIEYLVPFHCSYDESRSSLASSTVISFHAWIEINFWQLKKVGLARPEFWAQMKAQYFSKFLIKNIFLGITGGLLVVTKSGVLENPFIDLIYLKVYILYRNGRYITRSPTC